MRRLIRTTLLTALFVTALATTSTAQVSIGIQIGEAPPPPRVVYVVPDRPGPDFVWVTGYWFPVGPKYRWREGYWVRPPFAGAAWVMPRYSSGRYFEGYWSRPAEKAVTKGSKPGAGRGRGRGHNK